MDWQQRIENKLDRLFEKVEGVEKHCAKIDVNVERNTADVEHHIKRTDNLENYLKKAHERITPLERWRDRAKGVAWFLGLVGTLSGIFYTVIKVYGA